MTNNYTGDLDFIYEVVILLDVLHQILEKTIKNYQM